MELKDIVILSAVRTPIGEFGGALKDVPAAQLGVLAAKAALERASSSRCCTLCAPTTARWAWRPYA